VRQRTVVCAVAALCDTTDLQAGPALSSPRVNNGVTAPKRFRRPFCFVAGGERDALTNTSIRKANVCA